MALLDTKKALTREKRNGAVSHYHGTLASIAEDSSGKELLQRVRTFSQSSPGEISYALKALSGISGTAVIVYGAAGCSVSGAYFNSNRNVPWYSANLNESDTILGGEAKLRSAVLRAYNEYHPEAIFIVGTPINAINNDDVDSQIPELEDELSCSIIYVDVDGFKTKNAITGYDAVYHAMLKKLISPAETGERPFINLLTLGEGPENAAAIVELLRRLDIPCNILPGFSGVKGIRRSSSAVCSVSLDDGENEYFMTGLEEQYGVPCVRTNPPVGTAAIYDFITKIAPLFNKSVEAGRLIKEEERNAVAWISKKPFADRRVFLDMDLHRAVVFSALVEELGGEAAGLVVPCLDAGNIEKLRELASLPRTIPFITAWGQQFELVNILGRYPADIYIGRAESAAAAAGAGAWPLAASGFVYYGYAGIREMVKQGEKLKTAGFGKTFFSSPPARRPGAPYAESWFKRSGNWYVKLEVK
jgi:nitrogenase molybdenum-iron protein alpha chain